ncbi:EAL domain-containing protein [Vibrio taketomensis]|uniref:EAL domain-containing protein n=1 Tax=Vibrio taketomensis TaxID=2572923 RepID=UPI00138A0B22|nr:EAL domain-containing protein [Vibrio taketomensis]
MYNSSLPTDFRLVYQPKLHHEAIIGVEALLRPMDESITTLDYISSVQDKFKLDISVIDKVIKDVNHYNLKVPVSVNVHPSSMCKAEFISKVLECKDLIIELIEYEDLLFCECFYENVAILRKSGVMISLDDFGVDFATMDNALLLHPDQIKFDISLIKGIEKSYIKYRYLCFLYSKVVSLCTNGIIFEGVENIEQKHLIELFCEKPIFQGFYYYKPMKMSELIKLNLFDGPRVETLIDDSHHYDKFEYDVYSFVTNNSEDGSYSGN